MYGLKRLTTSTSPRMYIDLGEAKDHLGIVHNDQDLQIRRHIEAAGRRAEEATHRVLFSESWRLVIDSWPTSRLLVLPLAPLQSVTDVSYLDEDGVFQTLSTDDYEVDTDKEPGEIQRTSDRWPTLRADRMSRVKIEYVCGYGTAASNIPQLLRDGIKFVLAHHFDNRSDVEVGVSATKVPEAAECIFNRFRVGDTFESYDPAFVG